MFSEHYKIACEVVSDLSRSRPRSLDSLQSAAAADYVPFLWSDGMGTGRELDRAILDRSADTKTDLFGGKLFVIAPIM
jgi:hypothetical protein